MIFLGIWRTGFHNPILVVLFWLVVSTHLKNISQNGNLPQTGEKIQHI